MAFTRGFHAYKSVAKREVSERSPPTRRDKPVPRDMAHSDNAAQQKFWEPVFLRRLTILGFTAVFLILLLVLIVLWQVGKEDGLGTAHPQFVFLWTYAPTAGELTKIFDDALSLRREISDHPCKRVLGTGRAPFYGTATMDLDVWGVCRF
jgi:hypothetical protein